MNKAEFSEKINQSLKQLDKLNVLLMTPKDQIFLAK